MSDDLVKRYSPDLIAFTEPGAERLEFVEADVAVKHCETSVDGYVTILRDFDGDFVGFSLQGNPFQWTAFRETASRIEALEKDVAAKDRLLVASSNVIRSMDADLQVAREALEEIDAVAVDFGHLESALRTMKEISLRALSRLSKPEAAGS